MSEIEAIKAVDDALNALDPEARVRVLGWAQAKYGACAQQPLADPPAPVKATVDPVKAPAAANKTKAKPKTSKKSKSIIAMDKDLNLNPPGEQSAS